jgi:hypothetical protein
MNISNVSFSDLADKLPPLIARKYAEEMLGGIITAKTLANYEALGIGCPKYRIGRRVVYKTKEFLDWLASRATVIK